jgi:hypothetical protein
MRLQMNDHTATPDLGAFLRSSGAIVEQSGPGVIEVSLLGSFNDAALRNELGHAVRRWSFTRHRPDLHVAIG